MSDRASAKPKSLSDNLGISSDKEDILNNTNSSDSDAKLPAIPRNIDTLGEEGSDKDDMSLSSSTKSARSRKSSPPSSASSSKKKARLSITPSKASTNNMISLLDKET